ncbi:MAG: phosphoglycerate kinase [Candidatus Yanofskybacteria bacterium RIFCSPHIGHO2_02_FULL_39_10]|uniref:Phosphoglycerate kinase n=1 Tax=Candidatus Yanofskybacteria bacterium RIFCSPHIGHO2_02_FULL_39_10 TaxID=1802674 RepID=A0A1F8F9C9_9BACT|nr:MAG: phosphoglycerate kinase [Candidatus Yanofskybacteria bacterium RIFCSPHIGHO2_02_FULL_39_10]
MKIMPGVSYFKNKKVLLRCDFDVPVEGIKILEKFRVEKQKETIDFLLKQSSVVMVAHIKAIESFKDMLPQLKEILGHEIGFIDNMDELNKKSYNLKPGELYLLENIRNWSGEEENDKLFAKTLATGFDVYINNAFAVCHRNHASISAITEFLPSYAGFLVAEEVSQLNNLINLPSKGKIFIMGGAKASTKIPVIKNFINRSECILTGGVIANDILKARGVDVGLSVIDSNIEELIEGLDVTDKRLVMPVDYNIFENKIFDIGPKTIDEYINTIKGAEIIIWNGPVGLFEDERFSIGTDSIADAIASSDALKVLGGGDTITAVNKLDLIDKFDFVSTGGGAMLAFLAGDKLPGLKALGYYTVRDL